MAHNIFLIGVMLAVPAFAVQFPVRLPGELPRDQLAGQPEPPPLLVFSQVSIVGGGSFQGGFSAAPSGSEEETPPAAMEVTSTQEEACPSSPYPDRDEDVNGDGTVWRCMQGPVESALSK